MEIKKDTKVKVPYRPELGSGAVLQVASSSTGSESQAVPLSGFLTRTKLTY